MINTFQAIVYGIVHGFSQFLPISAEAHRLLTAYLLGWPEPSAAFAGALALGSFLAVLFVFRHDWASMIASVLQLVIYRKRPMTMDERVPLFVLVSLIPVAVASYYLEPQLAVLTWTPVMLAVSLVAFSLPLAFGEHFSRKNKGMYDWNWLDALIVGLLEIAMLIPGCGQVTAVVAGAMMRNYNREAAAKYAYFLAMPILGATTWRLMHGVTLRAHAPAPDLSWLSFAMGALLAFLCGVLAIGAFLKHVQRNGVGRFVAYRWLLAAVTAGFYWYRTRGGGG